MPKSSPPRLLRHGERSRGGDVDSRRGRRRAARGDVPVPGVRPYQPVRAAGAEDGRRRRRRRGARHVPVGGGQRAPRRGHAWRTKPCSGAYVMAPARRRLHGPARPTVYDLASAPEGFPPSSPLATVPAYQAADFSYVFKSFHGMPCVYDRVAACHNASDALVIKSCAEMEGPYIDYIAAQHGKPVLVTGPIVPEPPQGDLEERWATWLSSFPDNSVLIASFGSETFLPHAATTELLLGLEATNLPFLAVLNYPKGTDAEAELRKCTPPGLEARVKGRGILHTGWVQQQHILRHRSVGCFVNHSGLSSVMEGLVAGCRLVLLPMKGDQFLNAALLARELRVGTEVARRAGDGWFGREGVRDAVAAAVAGGGGGGDGEERKWREFLLDDCVQKRFAREFVAGLRRLKG
uniref:Glycosyltransferase n=1 Tax=Oryza punctata TaxID=4537 RepID=A0A0E0MFA5_ORYPU